MGVMSEDTDTGGELSGYKRTKVAPWENYTDGEWHEIRSGPADEPKMESERQYRRHWQSMRHWASGNGWRGQLSRTGHGRTLRVRFTRPNASAHLDRLRQMTRVELGRNLIEALKLLEYAFHLRVHGERAPGGNETWAEFDRRCEAFLRQVRGLPES
jgi:hypothetical protein